MDCALEDCVYSHSPLAPILSLDELIGRSEDEQVFDLPAPFNPIEDVIDAGRKAGEVKRFVEGLPAVQRDIVHRIFWLGQSQASIAQANGVSEAAVSRAMARALKQGRQALSHLVESQ